MAGNYDAPGAKALSAAIRGAGKDVKKSANKRLKVAGRVIVAEIASRTPVRSGKLQKATSARGSGAQMTVAIRNSAKSKPTARFPGGYRYGKRLEFDAATYKGRYRFFYPGFEAKRAEALTEMRKVLDDVAAEIMK